MYVITLMTGTLLMGTAAALVSMQMSQRRITKNVADVAQVDYAAQAGLDWAFRKFSTDPNWRATTTSGAGLELTLAGATVTVTPADRIDGDFTDDDTHGAFILAKANYDGAIAGYTVELIPGTNPTLSHAVSVSGILTIAGTVSIGGPVFAKDGLLAMGGATIVDPGGRVMALSTTVVVAPGVTVHYLDNAPASPSVKLNDYIALATTITPTGSAELLLSNTVLSHTTGWMSSVNPDGVYVIDCGGRPLRLEGVWVRGTLIITNSAGADVTIDTSCRFAEGARGFPVLLADVTSSHLKFNCDANADETVLGVDVNEDGDTSDVLEPGIFGLAWTSAATTTVDNTTVIEGSFISSGDVELANSAVIRRRASLQNALIHGFTDDKLHPVRGTIKEER